VDDIAVVSTLLSLSLLYIVSPNYPIKSYEPPASVPLEVFVSSEFVELGHTYARSEYDDWKLSLAQTMGPAKDTASGHRASASSVLPTRPLLLLKHCDDKPQHDDTDKLVPYLPNLCVKKLYWRLSCCLYLLGGMRPKTIGKFVWEALPSVQTLLLMSMTGRYYFPSTAASNSPEDRMAVMVGSSLAPGNSADGCVCYPRAKVSEANDAQAVYRSGNVDIFVSSHAIEVARGRLQELEGAVNLLEGSLCEYLFHMATANDSDNDARNVSGEKLFIFSH
jgi:hypothetical protein